MNTMNFIGMKINYFYLLSLTLYLLIIIITFGILFYNNRYKYSKMTCSYNKSALRIGIELLKTKEKQYVIKVNKYSIIGSIDNQNIFISNVNAYGKSIYNIAQTILQINYFSLLKYKMLRTFAIIIISLVQLSLIIVSLIFSQNIVFYILISSYCFSSLVFALFNYRCYLLSKTKTIKFINKYFNASERNSMIKALKYNYINPFVVSFFVLPLLLITMWKGLS